MGQCKDCKHWIPISYQVSTDVASNWGTCKRIEDDVCAGDHYVDVEIRQTFGCILFEKREKEQAR